VPQLRAAVKHLIGEGATTGQDWQVLLYTIGRALLWVVVLSACVSMYGYFRAFYRKAVERRTVSSKAERAAAQSAGGAATVKR
jgi:hypothetical protein